MSAARNTATSLVSIFILACVSASAQPGFIRTYAPPLGTAITGADATADGGMVYCGTIDTSGYLMRLDPAGNILWARVYKADHPYIGIPVVDNLDIAFNGVTALDNNSFMVVGSSISTFASQGNEKQQFTFVCDGDGG